MTTYENVATESIASFFRNEPIWKKEILFNYLLEPFGKDIKDIKDVTTQNVIKGSIPDFIITTYKNENYKFEVKINDTGLTPNEIEPGSRDAFLVRKNYAHIEKIRNIAGFKEKYIRYWEELFKRIDEKEATKDFIRLDLVREYMKEPTYTIKLNSYEAVMFYLPDEIFAVYSLSKKIETMCGLFLEQKGITDKNPSKKPLEGVGYFWSGHNYYIGLSPVLRNRNYFYSIAFYLPPDTPELEYNGEKAKEIYRELDDEQNEWAYIKMDKDILLSIKDTPDIDQQEKFNKEANRVLEIISKIIIQNNIKTTPIFPSKT